MKENAGAQRKVGGFVRDRRRSLALPAPQPVP